MSGEALYERYKDALRRGHVASLRGRLEEALTAYAEAAAIAPERATPHTSAGTALMRRKRPGDAVRHFTAAVRLAPRDEGALTGRAQALAAIDRRPQAADAYDALADVQAANGKLADAVDSARKGLELAEGRERRRTLVKLMERLRATDPGEPGRLALERALVVLEGRAIEPRSPPRRPRQGTPAKRATSEPAAAQEPARPMWRASRSRRARGGGRGRHAPAAPVAATRAGEAFDWPEADIARVAGTAPAAELDPEPELRASAEPEVSLVPRSTAARWTATCRPTSTSTSSRGRSRPRSVRPATARRWTASSTSPAATGETARPTRR